MVGGRLVVAVLVFLLLTGCSGDSDEQDGAPPTSSGAAETTSAPSTDTGETEAGGPPGRGGPLSLRLVASGLEAPVFATGAPGEPGRLYVVEQIGRIRVVEGGDVLPEPFLDLVGEIAYGGEQGLLSMAFHPDYETNRLFYVNFTDPEGNTRVKEYRAGGAQPVETRELLYVPQPYANHNGGQLAFGPDGLLYVGMGDGGSGGDPENRAQDLSSRLGKLLRVDVDTPGAEWEMVGFGLRNPWRFSFDRVTGDLWIGDVGQNAVEEVDFVASDQVGDVHNFGWDVLRGLRALRGQAADSRGDARRADHGVHARRRLFDHGGLRLPGLRRPSPGLGPLLLRRLLLGRDLEHRARGTEGVPPRPPVHGAQPDLLCRGPGRRALSALGGRHDLSARPALVGTAPELLRPVRCRTGAVGDRPLAEDDRVAQAKQGDTRAYGTLVDEHQTIAFRTAYLITGSAADAEDAVQEAFVKAYRALGRFRQGAPFRPWLLSIVANEARNRRRSAGRRERLALRAAEDPLSGGAVPSPEAALLDAEMREELLAAVNDLREDDRLVIGCRYFLGLSEEETAATLGWRRGTVKSRTSRALDRLRERMEVER